MLQPLLRLLILQKGGPDVSERQRRRQRFQGIAPVKPEETDEYEIDLMELLFKLLDNWKLILILALVAGLVTGVYVLGVMTPLYQATSTIYVLNRSDSAINLSDLQIGAALTRDYIKVFSMWEVHEAVISNLNLDYSYQEIEDMLAVTNDSDTRMLDITVTSPDPEKAAMISNEYARVVSDYIEQTMYTDKPSIMSMALVPTNPVNGGYAGKILLGTSAGAMLACVIVALQFILDDRIRTAEDIRKYTGLTTLAVVPREDRTMKEAEYEQN